MSLKGLKILSKFIEIVIKIKPRFYYRPFQIPSSVRIVEVIIDLFSLKALDKSLLISIQFPSSVRIIGAPIWSS